MRLWGWLFSAVLGGVGIGLLTTRFSPQDGKFWLLPAIYTALFFLIYGLAALGGFGLRSMFRKKAGRNELSRTASRQGVLFGVMSVAILMLLAANFFNWWSAGLLFLIFVLLELYVR